MNQAIVSPTESRRAGLERLRSGKWDLLVIGGGITGAGILLDAASRGLEAALIEQEDFAGGTSSRSTRLVHGGLRYLERFQVGLVREALAERAVLLRIAPHLVRLTKWLFPLYGGVLAHPFYSTGFALYDLLGAAEDGGRHRYLGVDETLKMAPPLQRRNLRGSLVYHDAQEDDARYVVTVVRTARALGALPLSRVKAIGPVEASGQIAGVCARDELSGETFKVRARRVVDATGAWSGRGDGPFPVVANRAHIVPSRGSHLIVPRHRIPSAYGLTLRIPGRLCFAVPWPDVWVIGTTDIPDSHDPNRLAISPVEVDSILGNINATLDVGLTRSDIIGTYTGLRPLAVEPGVTAGSTVRVSREHRIRTDPNGLVRISGGKFTTYRLMAVQTVDAALGRDARTHPSETRDLALLGAASCADLTQLAKRISAETGIGSVHAERLVDRHGSEATDVVRLGNDLDLIRPLAAGVVHLEAEVVYAAREEGALTVDDVMSRRMRLAQETPDRGASIVPRVARLLGDTLSWSEGQRNAAVEAYLASSQREYGLPTGEAISGSSD